LEVKVLDCSYDCDSYYTAEARVLFPDGEEVGVFLVRGKRKIQKYKETGNDSD